MRGFRTGRLGIGSCAFAAALALAVILFLCATPLVKSDAGTAGTGPKTVRGYVWDSLGSPVGGANITVNISYGGSVKATKYYDSTESNGFYTVIFGLNDWAEGDTIETTARIDTLLFKNSTLANLFPLQYVNVTLTMEIPEFGTFLGSSVALVTLGSILLFVAIRRSWYS